MNIAAIVAMDEARVIGRRGALPWHVPSDLRRFATLTQGGVVVMGSRTYESLPARYRPLPGRHNVVVSRRRQIHGVETWASLAECLRYYQAKQASSPSERLWVCGGASIYAQSFEYWEELYLTRIPGIHPGDTFFRSFEQHFHLVKHVARRDCRFEVYSRDFAVEVDSVSPRSRT